MPLDHVNFFFYFNQKNYKALSRFLILFVALAGLELKIFLPGFSKY